MENYAIRLPEAMVHAIKKLGGGDLSAGVRALYDKHLGRGSVK
jgi:hypothetical protein